MEPYDFKGFGINDSKDLHFTPGHHFFITSDLFQLGIVIRMISRFWLRFLRRVLIFLRGQSYFRSGKVVKSSSVDSLAGELL